MGGVDVRFFPVEHSWRWRCLAFCNTGKALATPQENCQQLVRLFKETKTLRSGTWSIRLMVGKCWKIKKSFFKGSLFKRHVLFVFVWGGIRWKLKMMISLKFCVCLSSGLLPWGFSKKPYFPWVLMWEGVEARIFQKQRMTHRLQRNIAGLGMFSLSGFNSCKVTTVAYIYLEIEEVGEARFTGINIPKFALNSSIPHEHAPGFIQLSCCPFCFFDSLIRVGWVNVP